MNYDLQFSVVSHVVLLSFVHILLILDFSILIALVTDSFVEHWNIWLVTSSLHHGIELLLRAWLWKDRTDGFDCLILGVEDFSDLTPQLVSFGLDILDGERNDSSSNLDSHCVLRLQSQLVLEQDDGSELGGVILNIETILLALDDSVQS